MATTKAVLQGPASSADERVSTFIPRGGPNDDPTAYVAINGVGYTIPKGEHVMVPRPVHEELMRSQREKNRFYDTFIRRESKE